MIKKLLMLLLFLALAANPASAITMFTFDSSPSSWVGQGTSVSVTPEDGYIFSVYNTTPNHVRVRIASQNSPFGTEWSPSSGQPYNYWTLDIAAPHNDPLNVGFYGDTARYPFQDDDQPGLTLSGNHRGNNRNGGFFEISDIVFDTEGILESLAVDFTQFGEEMTSRWITGSLYFNSDGHAPVPEPATLVLFGTAIVGFAGSRLRRKK